MPDSLLATGAVSEGLVVSLCGLGAFVGLLAWAVVYFRNRAVTAERQAGELATTLLDSHQLCRELEHESNYWRGLVKWKEEHADRNPTSEECDQMWERIIAQKPQFVAKPGVVISHDGQLAPHFDSLADLVRGTGGRL